MRDKKSIIELAEEFKSMEIKHRLFEKKTKDGIYFWDVLRYSVYMLVLSQNGIYENVGIFLDKNPEPFWKKIARATFLFPLYLLNEIRFLFLLPLNKKYCFLFLSRFEDEKGNPTDLLVKDIYEQLKNEAFIIEMFRHPSFNWINKNIGSRYFVFGLEIKYLLKKTAKDDWNEITSTINDEFNLDLDWKKLFETRMETFRKDYTYFRKLLKKIKPQYLFFQSEPKGLIAAANELDITTVDLQHGHTNNVDMMYSYPVGLDTTHVTSISKIFLTLGDFWNNILDFPNRMITSGSSYFHIDQDLDVDKRKGLMAVSTMFVHDFLKNQVAALANAHPEISFYYKLHSNQNHQIKESKEFFQLCENVAVIYTEKSVKELMDHCFAIALIQSSVAYQALQKGLKVFLFKHDYYEASYDIFGEREVILVEDWQEISKALTETQVSNINTPTIFFEPYNSSVIDKFLSTQEETLVPISITVDG